MKRNDMKVICTGAIELSLVKSVVGIKPVSDLLGYQIDVIRACNADLASISVNKHPTVLITSPCKTLFVKSVDDKQVITTSYPTEARAFPLDWAKENAHLITNGNGGKYQYINATEASERALEQNVTSVIKLINSLIEAGKTPLTDWSQIQGNYFGEFCRINNEAVK